MLECLDGKESTCNARDLGSIPGSAGFPGEGHGNLLQYSCLEHCYGQRSPAGYSPWDRKESDTTEQLSTAQKVFVRVNVGDTQNRASEHSNLELRKEN